MSSNEYMREYMLARYHSRMRQAKEALGGVCINCNSTEKLQLDHVLPEDKLFTVGKMFAVSEQRFWDEVSKCQLLCESCHIEKTLSDNGQENARKTHGTLSSYRYCRCRACKDAKNKHHREWKRSRRDRDTRLLNEIKTV